MWLKLSALLRLLLDHVAISAISFRPALSHLIKQTKTASPKSSLIFQRVFISGSRRLRRLTPPPPSSAHIGKHGEHPSACCSFGVWGAGLSSLRSPRPATGSPFAATGLTFPAGNDGFPAWKPSGKGDFEARPQTGSSIPRRMGPCWEGRAGSCARPRAAQADTG